MTLRLRLQRRDHSAGGKDPLKPAFTSNEPMHGGVRQAASEEKKDPVSRLITLEQGNAKAWASFPDTKLMAIGL
jgi:hypothetical protein